MLGIPPSQVYQMTPTDVYALIVGGQRKWNKFVELYAWGIWLQLLSTCKGIPKNFGSFMKEYTPPGWKEV